MSDGTMRAAPARDAAEPAPATRSGVRRPIRRPADHSWWLRKRSYFLFMVRELTAVFVGAYTVFLMYAVYRLGRGPDGWALLLQQLASPVSVGLHLVVLVFALYHAITWFNLTPKIMVVPIGEEQLPPPLVAGAVYVGWIAVSAVVVWFVMRG